MSDRDDTDSTISGEILPGGPEGGTQSALDLKLELPPTPEGVSLGAALLHQYRYWGLTRTMNAYRRAVESGVAALEVQTAFYAAARRVEMEKGRWADREKWRTGAREEADAYVERVRADRHDSIVRLEQSKSELARLREHRAAAEVLAEIAENNRAVELANAKSRRIEAERRLAEVESAATKKSAFQGRLDQMKQARADYEELMASKAAEIEKYGGEENLPDWAVAMYEQLEDELGFRV